MAFCSKCGSELAEGIAFCPQCGAPAAAASAAPPPATVPASSGIRENVAGLLCYVLGWLTGIIFLLIDKRPSVRFHAAQSIVVFGSLTLLRIVFGFGLYGSHMVGLYSLWALLGLLVSVFTVVLWIVLMITAWQGKQLEIPLASGFARSLAGSSRI
jgi:uncharacterized membrane protein